MAESVLSYWLEGCRKNAILGYPLENHVGDGRQFLVERTKDLCTTF